MRVDSTLTSRPSPRSAPPPSAPRTALRSTFATALTGATTASTTTTTAAASDTAATTTTTAAPEEETRPVEGKDYEEIISGPRNGMFINRSGNARDGEAFVLVKKDRARRARLRHRQGPRDRRDLAQRGQRRPPAPTASRRARSRARVEGELYDEITAGPRNGMFINRSGNARDGLAFVRVEHDHREDHIYGSGKHQQVIRMWDEGYGPDAVTRETGDDTAATGETGGHTADAAA